MTEQLRAGDAGSHVDGDGRGDAPPEGAFVVLYEDGVAVAGGGVRRLEAGVAEIKRMFVLRRRAAAGTGGGCSEALEAAAGRARLPPRAARHGRSR